MRLNVWARTSYLTANGNKVTLPMTRRLTLIAALALVALGGFYLYGQRAATGADPMAAYAQDANSVDTSMIADMTLGDQNAPVKLIEYASFTCPHCANFHAENFKKLKAEYIDTGKVAFTYREVYFDRPGLWASIVARCGENAESRYFGVAEMLYAQQQDWARKETPAEIVDSLRRIGKTAGLTDADLDQCLQDGDNAQALYAYYMKNAEADGIDSTPSFVIDGTKYSNMPWDEFQATLDAALAEG